MKFKKPSKMKNSTSVKKQKVEDVNSIINGYRGNPQSSIIRQLTPEEKERGKQAQELAHTFFKDFSQFMKGRNISYKDGFLVFMDCPITEPMDIHGQMAIGYHGVTLDGRNETVVFQPVVEKTKEPEAQLN